MENSFPQVIFDMYRQGKLRLQIVSLQAGSLVVTLKLTLQDPEFPVGVSTLMPMLPRLSGSTVFQVDQQGTLVQGRASLQLPRSPGNSSVSPSSLHLKGE